MRIAEIYTSVQGEGQLTGTPSVFVRASGCNLRCWFCDTPYASWYPEGQDLSVDEIVAQVGSHAGDATRIPHSPPQTKSAEHVVITGGEPMLFTELRPICEKLRQQGFHITIETAGTLYLDVCCDLMSISPKMANSAPDAKQHPRWNARHERTRINHPVMRQLLAAYPAHQLKFVVNEPSDTDEIDLLLDTIGHAQAHNVWLMPQGTRLDELEEKEIWLRPFCESRGFQFCPRRQIEWFGATRGS